MISQTAERFGSIVARGAPGMVIEPAAAEALLAAALDRMGPLRRVLLIPPDFTRFHSGAGELTGFVASHLRDAEVDILPALGTHAPMTWEQCERMFPGIAPDRILVHDWRDGLARLGTVPRDYVAEVSGGLVDYPIEIDVDRRVVEGEYDLILSLGQVVPHEVVGIANQSKNLFVGLGGPETINKTHFLGAAYGLERIMGRADTPVRRVLDYAAREFAADLPVCYVMTVRQRDQRGRLNTCGLYLGDDRRTFLEAATLSQQVNLDLLDAPLQRVVVWLDPAEYHSTWLGNKAIYRTRMAIADGGELIILAPGVRTFGEDAAIDAVIREFGYRGARRTLAAARNDVVMARNLSAAAHLVHGSSEGRFTIRYCPGGLSPTEIESVGYDYGELDEMLRRYPPGGEGDGLRVAPNGEEYYFVSNPALGLWALRQHFG